MRSAYIEGMAGDENQIDIDVAILQCQIQEAIYLDFVEAGQLHTDRAMETVQTLLIKFLNGAAPC